MASNIKGITIEFRGDTTKLDKAIRGINKEISSLDKELKQVNTALKFNPTNVDLWKQKQELLTQKVEKTKEKLDALKTAQKELDAKGVDKNTEEYRTLERQIIATESKVKTFDKQLRQIGNVKLKALSEQVKQVGTGLEEAGRKMSGLSLAAAGVVTALGATAVKAGQNADDLNTMSKVYGIATKDLQKYSLAANQVDVDVETIAKSQQKLKKSMFSASKGTGAQAEAFERLGVSVTDSEGNLKDSEVVFNDVLKALGTMTNETERDALAQQLLGKSAAELNPLIEDGGATYARVGELLQKYNLDYIDQETLDKANQFNDQLDDMKTIGLLAFQTVGATLAEQFAPVLEKVVDLVGRFANWLTELDPKVLTIIGGVAAFVAVLAPLLIGLGKVAFAVSSIINLIGVVGPAISALSLGPMAIIVGAIAAVIAIGVLLYKNWDKIKETASKVGESIKKTWESAKDAVGKAVENLKDSVVKAWDKVTSAVEKAAQSIWDALTWPFDKAYETIKTAIGWIKDLFPIDLSNFFGDIKLPHFSWDWIDIGGIISIPSIDIDWYKNGGIFSNPTIAGIGEAGSEAVVPLDKFWDKMDAIAAASQGGGEAPVINIYPQAHQSPTEIAREVERVLVQWQKQRSYANGNI